MSENGKKIKIALKGAAIKAKEVIGPIVAFLVPGVIIGGGITALLDSRRLSKLEKDHGDLVKTFKDGSKGTQNSAKRWEYRTICRKVGEVEWINY